MKIKKFLLLLLGCLSLLFGWIGIFLPILPTTPFVLLAASCFAGSSERMYHWLARSKYFGEFVKNYRERTGVTIETKRRVLLFLWIMLLFSAILIKTLFMAIILLLVGCGVTTHILRLKTKVE